MQTKSYAVLCVILLLVFGFYFMKRWSAFSAVVEGTRANETFISALREQAIEQKNAYDSGREAHDQLSEKIENNLSAIFPSEENYTFLTKQIDNYEDELSSKNDVFEVSNIDYQSPIESEEFSILPMRMNIKSSAENFTKFLHLVENSGALTSEVRLMDISSIRLNFEEKQDGEKEIINFSVQINAYFQK